MNADGRWRAAGLSLVWSALLMWPALLRPNDPVMLRGSQYSDLLLSHWPNAEFLRRSLFEYRQFPLWNPAILNGAPFAADPLAGLWYPPNWLTAILPLPFAFNLLLAIHLAGAGWGMFGWARAEGAAWWPSLVGGLAYAGLPKVVAHLGAGHVSLVMAVAWMPWLLWAADETWRSPRWVRAATITAIVWALIFLADVRWGVYAGLLLGGWWLFRFGPTATALSRLGLSAVLFALLTAVLWLPLAEFVSLSSRAGLTPAEASFNALGFEHLPGLLFAAVGGTQEYVFTVGAVGLALAAVGAVKAPNRRMVVALLLIAGLSLWWALGANGGLYAVAARLPGLSLLRVPSRSLFIFGLAACRLAVCGAEAVANGFRLTNRFAKLALVAAPAAFWFFALGAGLITGRFGPALFVAAGGVSAASLVLLLPVRARWVALALAAELWLIDVSLIAPKAVEPNPVAEWLARQPGRWRVYSPSFSLPPLAAARHGLEQADGVNPLQLASTVAFMETATGVAQYGYSVTLPPLAGDVSTANADAAPDAERLGWLNVRYVVSEFDLDADGLVLRDQIGGTRLYENTRDGGRVRGGTLVEWTPGRIVVAASGPARVTLAEVQYPGWAATVDGAPAELDRADYFRSVSVGSGPHIIVFQYQPLTVGAGLALSLMGLAAAGSLLWRAG